MTATAGREAPPPELLFRRRVALGPALRELWRSRETVRTLAERDIRVRYKQAVLGAAWAVLTPVLLMIVFNLVFRRIARVHTGGVPYPLFAYVALLPWTFFSSSVGTGSQSLVMNAALLNKIYCPREVFPISALAVAGVDMVVSASVLIVLFVAYGFAPAATSLWVPVLLLLLLGFTLAVTMLMSALVVYVRDLRSVVPMILQLGLFATPVAWEVARIRDEWRAAAAAANPLIAVIEGMRLAILYDRAPDPALLAPATASTVVLLAVAYYVFKRLEAGFADIA